uniref:Uncharacterized protein n=1 Tax=Anopheles culicifacies TaxID=139723 RepID=A0A182MGY4_9DIPT
MPSKQSSHRHTSSPKISDPSEPMLLLESIESVRIRREPPGPVCCDAASIFFASSASMRDRGRLLLDENRLTILLRVYSSDGFPGTDPRFRSGSDRCHSSSDSEERESLVPPGTVRNRSEPAGTKDPMVPTVPMVPDGSDGSGRFRTAPDGSERFQTIPDGSRRFDCTYPPELVPIFVGPFRNQFRLVLKFTHHYYIQVTEAGNGSPFEEVDYHNTNRMIRVTGQENAANAPAQKCEIVNLFAFDISDASQYYTGHTNLRDPFLCRVQLPRDIAPSPVPP